jgi:hypothetical protein
LDEQCSKRKEKDGKMADKIVTTTNKVFEQGSQSLQTDSSEAFEKLYIQVHALEKQARETFQYQFRRDYQAVVEKLSNGDRLDERDKQLISELIVSDAKSYIKYAGDYETWKDQIDRLLGELKSVQDRGVSTTDDLLHIQALCRDLKAVLPDITYYLREKERIQGYEQNDLNALSPELKKLLADAVKNMMESDKM